MRSVLVGAVHSSRVALEVMVEMELAPSAVVALPSENAGRHSDFVDLGRLAEEAGVPVIGSANVNSPEVLSRLREIKPSFVFVIGWSQICQPPFLAIPEKGTIGYHPSLLPENRGRAVIPWTILQEQSETGSTLFLIDEGMDSGDIIAQESIPVAADETASSLYDKHLFVLRDMMVRILPQLEEGSVQPTPQAHERATYCAKRVAADGLIDWSASAHDVWKLVRAVGKPYPGAFTYTRNRRMTVWEAEYVGDAPYTAIPGQVVDRSQDGLLVQCGDKKHVLLKAVTVDGEAAPESWNLFKMHEKLGYQIIENIQLLEAKL